MPDQQPSPDQQRSARKVSGLNAVILVAVLMLISAGALLYLSLKEPPAGGGAVKAHETPDEAEPAPLFQLTDARLPGEVRWAVSELSATELTVHVTTTGDAVRIELPPGVALQLAGEPEARFFTASRDVRPIDANAPATLSVILVTAGVPVAEPIVQPEVTLTEPPEQVLCWLQTAHAHAAPWLTIQTGIWALNEDLDVEGWNQRAAEWSIMPEERLPRVLRRAEQLLIHCVDDTGELQLFTELVAARQRLLTSIEPDVEAGALFQALDTLELLDYQGDPFIAARLLLLMKEHDASSIRRIALHKLFHLGLAAPVRDLRRLMVDASAHKYERVLAAWTLSKHQELTGLPILAAAAEDAVLMRFLHEPVAEMIANRSRQAKQPDETLLAYWTRAMGWDSLAVEARQRRLLREVAESLAAEGSPWLPMALNQLDEAEGQQPLLRAVGEVGLFVNDPQAFETLVTYSMHDDTQVQLMALAMLEPFYKFDLVPVYLKHLEQSPTAIVEAILTIAARDCDNLGVLFIEALSHASTEIRVRAIRGIGFCQMTGQAHRLIELAVDTAQTAEIRRMARESLGLLRSEAFYSLLEEELASEDETVRVEAARTLIRMASRPQALRLLYPYREDPTLGRLVEPHLRRHNYAPDGEPEATDAQP